MAKHVGKGDKQLNPLSQHEEDGGQVEKVNQHCYGVTELLEITLDGCTKLLNSFNFVVYLSKCIWHMFSLDSNI